jgi:hypothetical protein
MLAGVDHERVVGAPPWCLAEVAVGGQHVLAAMLAVVDEYLMLLERGGVVGAAGGREGDAPA